MAVYTLISRDISFTFNKMGIGAAINLHLLLAAALLLGFAACQRPLPNIAPATDSSYKETRLGESNYYVSIPDSYEVSEARGKEGQLGYSLVAKESEPGAYGFIEIRRGSPIRGELTKAPEKFAVSKLAGKDVEWFVEQTETGYFSAHTNETGDLNAKASSKDLDEVKTMVSIIATLKQK